MHRVGRYASNDIRSHRGLHGSEVFLDENRVVPVDYKKSHDPENEHTLQEIIIVKGIHQLAEITPDVP